MSNAGIKATIALAVALHTGSAVAADDVTRTGKQLFERYCASCHGEAGRGDGPVASSLRVEVPDLTRFAQRHGSFFDRELVERIIDGRHVIGAHGTRTMPVWGEDLSRAHIGDPSAERSTRIEIVRLADYIWQMQRGTEAPEAD
jgi:mono/diheme cytochrome c family protein